MTRPGACRATRAPHWPMRWRRPGHAVAARRRKVEVGAGQRAVVYMWVTLPDGDEACRKRCSIAITVKLGESATGRVDRCRRGWRSRTRSERSALRCAATRGSPSMDRPTRPGIGERSSRWTERRAFRSASASTGCSLVPTGAVTAAMRRTTRAISPTAKRRIAVADGDRLCGQGRHSGERARDRPRGRCRSRWRPSAATTSSWTSAAASYAFYAHLQPGSLKVKLGDKVRRGQVVGLVGNSGNSTEPHLHFHVSDANSPLGCEGLPYALDAFEVQGRIGGLQGGKFPRGRRCRARGPQEGDASGERRRALSESIKARPGERAHPPAVTIRLLLGRPSPPWTDAGLHACAKGRRRGPRTARAGNPSPRWRVRDTRDLRPAEPPWQCRAEA